MIYIQVFQLLFYMLESIKNRPTFTGKTAENLKTNTMKDTTIPDMGILISGIFISFYMPAT